MICLCWNYRDSIKCYGGKICCVCWWLARAKRAKLHEDLHKALPEELRIELSKDRGDKNLSNTYNASSTYYYCDACHYCFEADVPGATAIDALDALDALGVTDVLNALDARRAATPDTADALTDALPDRCPDCGAVEHNGRPAVRLAKPQEVAELLRMRAEDNS